MCPSYRVLLVALSVAHFSAQHARYALKRQFKPPKAPPGKRRHLFHSFCGTQFISWFLFYDCLGIITKMFCACIPLIHIPYIDML